MRAHSKMVLAVLVMAGGATSAMAGVQTNGVQVNGVQVNGVQVNGVQVNGVQVNGVQVNGVQVNGVQVNGVQVDGSQVSGSLIGSGSCLHSEGVAGAALPPSCSKCSEIVNAVDSYCSTTSWDSICVNEAVSMCRVVIGVGSTINATLASGATAKMRIDASVQAANMWNGASWINMADVYWNTIRWVVEHAPNVAGVKLTHGANACITAVCNADSYCCNVAWDSICVGAANSMCMSPSSTAGNSVCGNVGLKTPRKAVFIGGTWNMDYGYDGAGGKVPSTSAFSIGCQGVGAIAKCVDMGYKPWSGTAGDQLHQSCVRMVRADYCGDGVPWTYDGNTIEVKDYTNIQIQPTATLQYDGAWNADGARWGWYGRGNNTSPLTTLRFSQWRDAHPYCQSSHSTPSVYDVGFTEARTLNSTTNKIINFSDWTCPTGPMSPCLTP